MRTGLLTINAGAAFSQLAISQLGNVTRVQAVDADGNTKNKMVSAEQGKNGFAISSPHANKGTTKPGEGFIAKFSSRAKEMIANFYGAAGDGVHFAGSNIKGKVFSSAPEESGRPLVVKAENLKNSSIELFGSSILITDKNDKTIYSPKGLGNSKVANFDAKGNVSFSALAGFEAMGAVAAAGPKFV